MSSSFFLQEIVAKFGGELISGDAVNIHRVSSLSYAQAGHISFIADSKYLPVLANTQASAVIVGPAHRDATQLPRIVTDNPYAYFAKVSALLNPPLQYQAGIASSARVDASALVPASCCIAEHVYIAAGVVLGESVVIGPGSVVMAGTHIADETVLEARVTVYHACEIGKRCHLSAGAVIGADGFGYAPDGDKWLKIPQIGRVIIKDDVVVGANTTIDRGALDDTVIEEGVKLDNLIQIGHNCIIGANTVIAGCVGIAGSARIGRNCRIGGAAMILGHLQIANGVTITPGSMITRSLNKKGTYTALMPFQEHEDWLKTAANIRKMNTLAERVKLLEQALSALQTDK